LATSSFSASGSPETTTALGPLIAAIEIRPSQPAIRAVTSCTGSASDTMPP
jgi:hypothetical protein